ncbi:MULTISPECIES: cbb3-type cytochrome oxidase assembly protein CcoS [Malaciobacter]|jgi:cbb3-type cytochrome oxidase maturation protein|uniref:Cbb3-type cytochrome oxidase assembly protein CcoS n=1 Tax=Malaciobacter marinus TaxID=505249 RepID=A0A1T5A5E4_9BACT|nr:MULTISPECIES: cbb3-type cytochrome oxidase assembly protein CcoS [Malaciobacter]AXX86425.1 cytochrome oxidase maturation protein, cbb3-type [Malaciobacter marinus]PHO12402.1 cbb3-type cytochrome oxidase assembly protein CcoS [Malaciobacter marinus]PHO15486.1 cbb3-type cytochrome oxidase assembly protein CcoS [Malaciobacter marinus]PPK62297.1 cbb3-type cytochrome oxidase maturation protein [Malaciobacter marinus]RYA23391.1 cbb3-type cytochrome oxidase assembly protein CcoS [Malaciobacter hal
MIDGTLLMMLVVALVVSFAILGVFIWGAKGGQFDDGEKMMGGLLFDSTEDLNDARKKEQKKMNAKKEQKKSKLDK